MSGDGRRVGRSVVVQNTRDKDTYVTAVIQKGRDTCTRVWLIDGGFVAPKWSEYHNYCTNLLHVYIL